MNIGFMIFELVVQVFAFVTYVGYHLGLKQGRKPASLAFSEGLTYSFLEWIAWNNLPSRVRDNFCQNR